MFAAPLRELFPEAIVIEIVLFEGRVFRAYLRDYIGEVYSATYKKYFGNRYSLKFITGGFSITDTLSALPFYAAWSTVVRARIPSSVRLRKCRKFSLKYDKIIPQIRLKKERKKIEERLKIYFQKGTQGARRSVYMLLNAPQPFIWDTLKYLIRYRKGPPP